MGQSWKHIYLLLQTLTGLPKPCRQANPKLKFLLPGCTMHSFCCLVAQLNSFYCLVAQCTRLWRSRLRWKLQNGNGLEEIGSIISPPTTFSSMDTSLAELRPCMKCDAKNSNPCSVWIFKDRSDIDKRYQQQQQQVRGGHFMAPASCLLSKQLLAVLAAKLPEVIACFCCPSSCSCPCHCPCPQLLAAHPA